ncbi:LysR family transcriptional regulator [Bosea sp. (in: a-proteobacteria)]|uniref:LysR family transcriptional regulator n=1 Tax=Bosea sp. (in: a-proteobacteria) TaxID=1871050 RepID=UPI002613697C|nr:LysR family transcriptional regulator [Bosea sp. (in: a-proteobacteria)]MCO5090044.1 LysR family transcriptional regulator [Bosea sp. (in: a-proteobacteria)]
MIELRELRNFIRVAELGSISAAAVYLHMAQPGLSRQIRLLETRLGTDLFVRNGRGVVLTHAGERLKNDASELIEKLSSSIADIQNNIDTPSGEVRLGILPNLGAKFYADILTKAKQRYPLVKIIMFEGYSHDIVGWLKRKVIHAGLVYEPGNYPEMRPDFTFVERAVLASKEGLSSPCKRVSFSQVVELPLIVPSELGLTRHKIDQAARLAGKSIRCEMEVDSYAVTAQLAMAGNGYAVFPRSFIWHEVEQGFLQAVEICDPEIQYSLSLLVGAGTAQRLALSRVAGLIKETVADYRDRGRWGGNFSHS